MIARAPIWLRGTVRPSYVCTKLNREPARLPLHSAFFDWLRPGEDKLNVDVADGLYMKSAISLIFSRSTFLHCSHYSYILRCAFLPLFTWALRTFQTLTRCFGRPMKSILSLIESSHIQQRSLTSNFNKAITYYLLYPTELERAGGTIAILASLRSPSTTWIHFLDLYLLTIFRM